MCLCVHYRARYSPRFIDPPPNCEKRKDPIVAPCVHHKASIIRARDTSARMSARNSVWWSNKYRNKLFLPRGRSRVTHLARAFPNLPRSASYVSIDKLDLAPWKHSESKDLSLKHAIQDEGKASIENASFPSSCPLLLLRDAKILLRFTTFR